ncbi:MAG: glycosyltransferase family 4 protein [Roseobacter sp.]|jgi:glycosyltransferase involved in cell wall biosynthesis|nr:glycosyltransferase family 4 protein [Roseobacter sp.]
MTMKFAYLMNAYPMTSTTFIRREIEAHERAGFEVKRFAIRQWDQPLVDPRDIAEVGKTYYLLEQGALTLLLALLREMLINPIRLFRAVRAMLQMMKNTDGEKWKQIAYLMEAVLLKQQTTAQKIDHLHAHFSTNSAGVAMLSFILGGPTYGITVHGPDELFEMSENSLTLKVHHAAYVAVITDYCHRTVDTHTGGLYPDKIHVVRCGLELSEFEDHSDVPENRDLVCVGRICKAKAQVLLVEAIGEIAGTYPDVKLTLIGDGDQRPAVEAAIDRLELHDNVEIAGWKQNEEVRATLKASRALLLPSLAEGLPIVIMESFALGRPVLTTEIYGIPELVDASCGWLAQPGDKETLVQSLLDLLSRDTQTLSQMGRIGRDRVLALHDQDVNAEQLRALFFEQPAHATFVDPVKCAAD